VLDNLAVPRLRALYLVFSDEARRHSVVGTHARAPDVVLEILRRQRGEPLPTRALRLVDAEIGELRSLPWLQLATTGECVLARCTLVALRHVAQQLARAPLGAHPDFGRLGDDVSLACCA
jgi:hypothetical protein